MADELQVKEWRTKAKARELTKEDMKEIIKHFGKERIAAAAAHREVQLKKKREPKPKAEPRTKTVRGKKKTLDMVLPGQMELPNVTTEQGNE